jgi:regulator of protease activity HflC (stomatin/prohibitin superfamily)
VIFLGLLLVLTVAAIAGAGFVKMRGGPAGFVWAGYAVLALVLTALSTYHQVNAGHVGLVYEFGQITGETGDGPQFIAPWKSLREVNVQVQSVRFHPQPNNDEGARNTRRGLTPIAAASSETQNVFFDVTLNWQLDRGHVRDLYNEVGPGFFDTLVPSRVHQFFKAEVVKYEAVQATQRREAIREAVTRALDADLEPFGISIVALQVDNISYNPAFEEAIEQKQVATQQALRAQEIVAQRDAEARQAEAIAKGEAAANVARAEGDARAITTRANAQAEANRQLAASLTPSLLQSQAIEKMDGTKIAVLPSGSGFLLDPATILGGLQ